MLKKQRGWCEARAEGVLEFLCKESGSSAAVWRVAEGSLPPSLTASLPGHIPPDRRPLHPRYHHLLCSHDLACLFPDLHGQGKLPTWGSNETRAACWTPGPHNLNALAPGSQGDQDTVINSSRHSFFPIFIYFISLAISGLPYYTQDLSLWFTDPLSFGPWAQLLSAWDLDSPIRDRTHVLCIYKVGFT